MLLLRLFLFPNKLVYIRWNRDTPRNDLSPHLCDLVADILDKNTIVFRVKRCCVGKEVVSALSDWGRGQRANKKKDDDDETEDVSAFSWLSGLCNSCIRNLLCFLLLVARLLSLLPNSDKNQWLYILPGFFPRQCSLSILRP